MLTFKAIDGGPGIPSEPDWATLYNDELDREAAAQYWMAAVCDLRAEGTLAASNGPAMRRLVHFQVQYDRAARHVAENGAILQAKHAKIGQFNPYWAVMKHASEELRQLEAALSLGPTSRGKAAKAKRAEKTIRASDKYTGLKSVS